MSASLSFIGHTCLGRTGSVKLSELNSADAESRVYTTGTDNDLRRVNNNEEAEDDCPSEADAASSTVGAANSLAKWDGYAQWETSSPYTNQGEDFNLTAKDGGSSQHTGTADFSWAKPAGYANFPQGYVQQELWVRPCTGSSFPTDCENDSPFTEASSRRYATTDGTTAQAAGLTSLGYYVAGVRMMWNDENDSAGTYTQTGVGYRIHASLAEGGTNYGDSQAIVFRADQFIPCTAITPGLSTTSGTDGGCDACDNWNIQGNRTTVKVNHTGFANGKTLYNNSGDCVLNNRLSSSTKWASNDGETAYTLSTGLIGSPTVDCTDTEVCEGF